MRTLVVNEVGPILLIACTNHALDHLLASVLDKGITSKLVRLGSRSKDERISKFSIESLEQLDTSTDRASMKQAYRAVKSREGELNSVLVQLQARELPPREREAYLTFNYEDHLDELIDPPRWVQTLRENEVGWTPAGGEEITETRSEHDFWAAGVDLDWIIKQRDALGKDKGISLDHSTTLDIKREEDMSSNGGKLFEYDNAVGSEPLGGLASEETGETAALRQFLAQNGLTELPALPVTDRPLEELQENPLVWQMSKLERNRLSLFWTEAARIQFLQETRNSFADLKEKYETAREAYEESQAQVSFCDCAPGRCSQIVQVRLSMLKKVDIIGCTTTGAAKLTKFLHVCKEFSQINDSNLSHRRFIPQFSSLKRRDKY
jgi:hypothetical protein